ncbi:PAS domain-containing sensor histidine kinase [Emcibacter nanhaiensis]|uniref:histidine kinase n=1 Tax=Emcibacter nanhaiensis TaxID=1505037 RepID=A0A501PBT2_9PROT|nr:PAS domain-containing sensor histidine kinase [Emcibacter nanhaiensis]TPD57685.1 PAS domain S-box protein [Emcibacter nanhaiensis]
MEKVKGRGVYDEAGGLDPHEEISLLRSRIAVLRNSLSYSSTSAIHAKKQQLDDLEDQLDILCPLLEGQDNFFRHIVEELTDIVVLSDEKANIQYVNPVIETLLGYTPQEVLGRNVKMLMQEVDSQQHEDYVTSYLSSGHPKIIGVGRDVVCRHKSGEFLPFELRLTDTMENGRVYFIGTLRDIQRRKKAEELASRATMEAISANKAKSDFLANMSHELRTPLNAIIGYSEMLEKQFFGEIGHEKYLEYAGYIKLSGDRLLNLVNDVLDISKIEAGRYELVRDVVEFENIVADLYHEFVPLAESAQVRLVVDCEKEIGRVYVDEKALKQVLSNLVSNAIKFSYQDKEVRLSVMRKDAGQLCLVVQDEGIGMSQEEIDVALTSFGQVQSSLVRNHQGTGLGLPLSRYLVRLHGGTFSLESKPREGTRITVTLPAEKDKSPS